MKRGSVEVMTPRHLALELWRSANCNAFVSNIAISATVQHEILAQPYNAYKCTTVHKSPVSKCQETSRGW